MRVRNPPASLQEVIPKPNPKKHRSIKDARDWHNSKLVVRPGGIEIIGITPAGQPISLESGPEKLEQLPDSAWLYGLIVMVEDAHIISSAQDMPRIEANRSKLLTVLNFS